MTTPVPDRLPVRTKVLYGIGSMSDGAQLQLVGGILLLYYNQVVGLPAQWVSLALAISVFADAFWDPAIGHVSDHLRTRWGRRHPFMYAAVLPAGLAFALLWTPPQGMSDVQTFAWLAGFVMLFRFFHSCYMVPAGALTPELAPAYHDRTVLIAWRWLLGATGGAITAVLVYGIFLRATPEYPQGQLNPAGYPGIALSIGAFITATILIASLGTHHRIPTLHKPAVQTARLREAWREISGVFRNRNFIVSLVAGGLGATSGALSSGLSIYFNTFLFELPSSNLMVLVLTLLVSAPIAFVLAPALSRRVGKRNACMGLFFAALVFAHGPILLRLANLFPENGTPLLLPLLLVANTLTGILGMGGYILVSSMVADIVEDSMVHTGRRSEGFLFSADNLLQKVVSGFATVLPGLLLAAVGFPQGARPDTLDPQVMRNLALVYVPVAATLSLLAIATWRLYRIDEATHARNLGSVSEAAALAETQGEGGLPPAVGVRAG